MKFLLLINGAPYHRPFFRRVGDALREAGHSVVYAVDSRYTDYLYQDEELHGPTYYFSEYLEKNIDRRSLPPGYENCNVWRALFSDIDRFSYSSAHYRTRPGFYESVAANLLHFFDEIFEREKFDCITYECVSNSFVHFAYEVAEKFGAKFVGYLSSRIPKRTDIIDSRYMLYTKTPKYYQDVVSGSLKFSDGVLSEVRHYIDEFERSVPDYMIQLEYLLKNPLQAYVEFERFVKVFRSLRYFVAERKHHEFSYQVGNPIVAFPRQFQREVVRWAKVRYLRERFYKAPDFGDSYFLYPMQYHPESSTSVNAMYFVSELDNVRNISVSLPYGIKLYVRDHPHAAGRQPISFYEDVAKLPNVKMIGTAVAGKTLVKHAKAVVTCTSSMGYEAVVLGTPVYTLGQSAYAFHPSCRPLKSFDDAYSAFSQYRQLASSPAEREAFVLSYYASSIKGTYDLEKTFADRELIERVSRLLVAEASLSNDPPMSCDVA